MEFLTTFEIAEKWKITRRRVSKLCSEGLIKGAVLKGEYIADPIRCPKA